MRLLRIVIFAFIIAIILLAILVVLPAPVLDFPFLGPIIALTSVGAAIEIEFRFFDDY